MTTKRLATTAPHQAKRDRYIEAYLLYDHHKTGSQDSFVCTGVDFFAARWYYYCRASCLRLNRGRRGKLMVSSLLPALSPKTRHAGDEPTFQDFAEAEAHYTEALRINPRAAYAHNSLGHLLHHRKKVGKVWRKFLPVYGDSTRGLECEKRTDVNPGSIILD